VSPRALLLALGCALIASTASAAEPLVLVYTPGPAAEAIVDGTDAIPGLTGAYRQAPAAEDFARFPLERRVGKVSGVALSSLTPERMAAEIRAAWDEPGVGDLVGVDEIRAAQYGPAQSRNLARAMELLGPDAQRVIFYAAPSTVQQIGRVDRRLPLEPRLALLRDALAAGGHTYLQLYHGDYSPFDRSEMARELTGWVARWPEGELHRLHVVTGRETGATQAEIWNRLRASAAGRTLLASGPAVYGLQSAGEGTRWLAGYRGWLQRPDAVPPGGDEKVPEGGGLVFPEPESVVTPGSPMVIRLGREGRAVVQLILPDGRSRGLRAIAVTDPVDLRPRLRPLPRAGDAAGGRAQGRGPGARERAARAGGAHGRAARGRGAGRGTRQPRGGAPAARQRRLPPGDRRSRAHPRPEGPDARRAGAGHVHRGRHVRRHRRAAAGDRPRRRALIGTSGPEVRQSCVCGASDVGRHPPEWPAPRAAG